MTDGILLAEPAAPDYVRWARARAGGSDDLTIATYAPWCVMDDADDARATMAPWLGDLLDHPHAGFASLSFGDDLLARWRDGGLDGLATMRAAWWTALGPIGTMDDAVAHLQAVAAAGASTVACYPAPDVDRAHHDIDLLAQARAILAA